MNTEKKTNRSISAKHQEKFLSNSETKPSEVADSFWVYAKRKKGEYPKSTPRSGKWLIFVNLKNVNEVWANIKKAVEEGRLGDSAKVATAKKKPLYENSNVKVICVYTYDWADEKDVRRIREELKKLGITNKIPYKADQDTYDGKYSINGNKNISKYYE